jgi:mannose-1-phosphate guanylyltransferase
LKANESVLHAQGQRLLLGEGTANGGAHFDDWVVVGRDCQLGKGVELSRSVLLDGVVVGDDVTIKDSILSRGVRVGDGAALVDCVVGEGARVEAGVLLKNMKIDPSEGA